MKIKIVHNSEIHLLILQNPTLQEIREHIQKIYPNINSNFTLSYKDSENDYISLTCQEDLQILVDEGIETIKVFVVISQKPQSIPQNKMVHNSITCDGCQIYPITGSRFKCLECQDYDLCEECQAKGLHIHHKFFKISTEEELQQFRKTHQDNFGHWEQRPRQHGGEHGFHGHGFHGHGFHGHGFHGHEAFKQFRELFQDPKFNDIKQTFCSIAKDVMGAVKTEIEKHKNSQQQKQEEKSQEECNINEKQETQQETQQDNTNQQSDCKVQEDVEDKIKNLIQILQCDEKVAREYVECFKDLSLDGIVDIIFEKQ